MTKIKTTVSIRMSDETPQREESYPNDYNKATNMPEEKFNKVIIDWYNIITSFIIINSELSQPRINPIIITSLKYS